MKYLSDSVVVPVDANYRIEVSNDFSLDTSPENKEYSSPDEYLVTFRQLGGFFQNEYSIDFKIFCLSNQEVESSSQIIVTVRLISNINDTLDYFMSRAQCVVVHDEKYENESLIRDDLTCDVENFDKAITYKSLELFYSIQISGIPEDETLINTEKTQNAIDSGLLSYLKE